MISLKTVWLRYITRFSLRYNEVWKLTLMQLMRHFDWSLARPDHPWKEANYIGIFAQHDMWVIATERRKAV